MKTKKVSLWIKAIFKTIVEAILDSYMFQIDIMSCEHDSYVCVKSFDDGSFIFMLLYVDNMLIVA